MKENLDNLIKESMIAKTSDRTLLLRDIKTEFSKAETAKDFKKLDEIAILKSMKKRREDSANQYQQAGRLDLAKKELTEILILEEFLPEPPTEEEIKLVISNIIYDLGSVNIGIMMKEIKFRLPKADMKLTSNIVKSLI